MRGSLKDTAALNRVVEWVKAKGWVTYQGTYELNARLVAVLRDDDSADLYAAGEPVVRSYLTYEFIESVDRQADIDTALDQIQHNFDNPPKG